MLNTSVFMLKLYVQCFILATWCLKISDCHQILW